MCKFTPKVEAVKLPPLLVLINTYLLQCIFIFDIGLIIFQRV